MHEPIPPTTNDYGDEVHPAYGYIQASRTTSTPGQVLFDSDIRHGHTVVIRIGHMTRKRDLNRDWNHAGREEVEVELSEAQWAGFVSAMNTPGVPCTIRHLNGDYNIPGLEFEPRLAVSIAETHAAAERAFADIRKAMAAVDALDSKAGAKARRDAQDRLRSAIANATPNVDFAARSLIEHTENVVQRARADVEAMVTDRAASLGIDSADLTEPLALPGSAD